MPSWDPTPSASITAKALLPGAAEPWTHKYRKGNPYEDTWHRDGKHFHEEGNTTELVTAETVRRIEEKNSPWFIYVPSHALTLRWMLRRNTSCGYAGVKFNDDPEKNDSRHRLAAMVSQLDK